MMVGLRGIWRAQAVTCRRAEAVAAAGAVKVSTSAHFVPFAFQGS